jgi:hypothetical protein
MSCDCFGYDCIPVLACVNQELLKVNIGDSELSNLCATVIQCVDAEFEAFKNGQETGFTFYPQALLTVLGSLDGYSDTGELYLRSFNGSYSWVSAASAIQTYFDDGIGISVSGLGTLGNPYKPNLITSYVRSLFTASNGLTSSFGATTLGGTLTQNTNIDGGGFSLDISNLNQGIIRGNTVNVRGSIAASHYGEGVFNADQTSIQIVNGSELYYLDLNDVSGITTLGSSKDLVLHDGTQTNPLIVGTSKTFLRIVNYHHADANDVLSLVNPATGEVAWTTPAAPGGTYTDEQAQDAVGAILTPSATISYSYNDLTPSITSSVIDGSISFVKIQNVSTDKLIGRDTAASGSVEEIGVTGGVEFNGTGSIQVSAFTGDVTKPAGSTVTTIADDSVTNTKIRDSSGFSVIGKATTGSGNPDDIVANTDGVLRRSGSGDLQFGTLVTGNIGDDQITFAKTQNISTQRILGRSTAGSGNIEELTIGSGILVSGGSVSTLGRTLIGITKFEADGTWTKPVGCNAVLVYTVGAGGGGAGANSASGQAAMGAGGGGGAYSVHYITSGLGSTEDIVIGVGGTEGNSTNSYTGQSGTASSFGLHTGVNGGDGGQTAATGVSLFLGAGGVGGVQGFHPSGLVYGGGGEVGGLSIRLSGTVAIGGSGGSSILGGGDFGYSYGAGGAGSVALNGATADGNPGTNGIVIIYEYS